MNAPDKTAPLADAAEFGHIPVALVFPSPTNPRKNFDAAKLEELAASIRLHGVLQPIIVRPRMPNKLRTLYDTNDGFELVAGERRWRAAKLAKQEAIPALVRSLTDIQVLEMQVIENLQRDDLHPIEEADGYDKLIKGHGYTADTLAEKIGKSRSYVYGRLKLAALVPKARDLFYTGKIEASIALLVARIPPAAQLEAAKEIIDLDCSYRQAVDLVQDGYMVDLKSAEFPVDDATLLPNAGACKTCPMKSGNAKDLFTDVKNPNVCTDPDCFKKKDEAFRARRRAEHEAKGDTVITGPAAKKIKPHAYGRLNDNYVELDDDGYIGGNWQTYRKAIGKQPCATALLECPFTGKLLQVAKRADVNAAIKANGIDPEKSPAGDSSNSDQKAKERKAKLETAIRQEVLREIRYASRTREFDRADTVLVASAFFDRLGFDSCKHLVDAWNAADNIPKPPGHEYVREFGVKIPTLSNADLHALFIDMALIGSCHVAAYSNPSDEDLLATAERLKIDTAAIRTRLTAAAKAKEAAKKKTVKK